MNKPYQSPQSLLGILEARGLELLASREQSLDVPHKYGYHRIGGYRYVFREQLPLDEHDPRTRTFRSDNYIPGSKLEEIESLAQFGEKLRIVTLQGVLDFETRLRVAITEAVAHRSPTAHVEAQHLDAIECAKPLHKRNCTKFDAWKDTCSSATRRALSHDDYVIHHQALNPGHPLPVWATMEVLSFGSLPAFIDLMRNSDRQKVARQFRINHDATFRASVRQLVDLRNSCAHGQRLYNRNFKRPVRTEQGYLAQPRGTTDVLRHFASVHDTNAQKLYPVAALLAYALKSHRADSKWHLTFKTQVRNLQKLTIAGTPSQNPVDHMGFPKNWETLELWT